MERTPASSYELEHREWSRKAALEVAKTMGLGEQDIPSSFKVEGAQGVYESLFCKGLERALDAFIEQNPELDMAEIAHSLDAVRVAGDQVAIGKKEQEVAGVFQRVISSYDYEGATNQLAEILAYRRMNCVGASTIGAGLLNRVGIPFAVAGVGAHSLLMVATSDNQVLWQDMQEGKERPVYDNGPLSPHDIEDISRAEIVEFIRTAQEGRLSFTILKKEWKNEVVAIEPYPQGVMSHQLLNIGFGLGNQGKPHEALAVLKVLENIDSENAAVYVGKARAFKQLGRKEDALLACKKALSLDSSYSYVRDELIPAIEAL